MKFTNDFDTVWRMLYAAIPNKYGVAGLMGNLYAESGIKSICLENLCIKRYKEKGITYTSETYTEAVDAGVISKQEFVSPMGKHYGYGLVQWTTDGRKTGLYDWCKNPTRDRPKTSIGDLKAQVQYLYYELATAFSGVLKVLLNAKSVKEASDKVLSDFERPANWEARKDQRAACGQEIYDHYYAYDDIKEGASMGIKEDDIVLCGHGSGHPSVKNMAHYLESRYQSLATNGKRRGLVEVRRLKALTDPQREKFRSLYKTILGRNIYNQNLREYCYKKYADANNYSDCSSSGILTFKEIGHSFPWTLNTAGIRDSPLFETVGVKIVNGHVTNPEILKVGDCLLFVGNDPSRPLQIGHVEYIYSMPDNGSSGSTTQYPKWIQSGNDWYYRIAEGQNAHGWRLIAESGAPDRKHWYHFGTDGKMDRGWVEDNGKWYYLQSSGALEGACWHETEAHDGSLEVWTVG